MTDERWYNMFQEPRRRLVAALAGWTQVRMASMNDRPAGMIAPDLIGTTPSGTECYPVPNYLWDLNSMQALVKDMPAKRYELFARHLLRLSGCRDWQCERLAFTILDVKLVLLARADQWAHAYVTAMEAEVDDEAD